MIKNQKDNRLIFEVFIRSLVLLRNLSKLSKCQRYQKAYLLFSIQHTSYMTFNEKVSRVDFDEI